MLCQMCDAKNPDGARFCSDCGMQLGEMPAQAAAAQTRPIALQPARWRKRGVMKTCLLVSGALFALLLVCAGLGAAIAIGEELSDGEAPAGEAAPAAAATPLPIPEQQAKFIQTVESFYQPYQAEETEQEGSTQRAKRREALAALLPERAVQNWTGTVESVDTNAEGYAYLTIRPDGAESITIATWNNALADVRKHFTIPSGSDLYENLTELRAGDRVVFSGTFADGDEDYIGESSLTEAGSMTTPGFVMVFSDVTEQE